MPGPASIWPNKWNASCSKISTWKRKASCRPPTNTGAPMKTGMRLGTLLLAGLLAACSTDGSAPPQGDAPLQLTLLHVNDHHSHLQGDTASVSLRMASG